CPARKDTPIQFELPSMVCAADAHTAAASVVGAVASGDLTPMEGASVMGLVESYRRTLEVTEFDARIHKLEQAK
ncbi:MAG: hypothetical protein ACJAXU_001638, partial [Paracoccaceae bacterium]